MKKTFGFTKEELAVFSKFKKPADIQKFINSIPYDPDIPCRSPRYVIKERKAHCFEGALFAAAALRMIGYKPLIVDLRAIWEDDDHVIAVFKQNGHWGSIAKSNYSVLRYREPVYKSIRELAMSSFDFYFTPEGIKTMREYSRPLNLTQFDRQNWMTTEKELGFIAEKLDDIKHHKILTPAMIRNLNPADPLLIKAGLLGSDPNGLYKKHN